MSRLRASLLRFRPGKGLGAGLLLARHFQISANYNAICKKNADIWNSRNMDYSHEMDRSRFHAWQFSIGYYF